MRALLAFGAFWYDFIVGDDWTIAAAVALTVVVLVLLGRAEIGAWWLLTVVVVLALGASIWRAARSEGARRA